MSHPNKLLFIEGTKLIFDHWQALNLSIQMELGGVDSLDKKVWFLETIIDLFDNRKLLLLFYKNRW